MGTNNKSILVIEHEKPMATVLGNKLHALGFSVAIAPTEHEAIALLAEQTFDLIVVGLSMPEADSIALLTSWKGAARPAPIVVLAAESQRQEEVEVRALGAEKFLIPAHIGVAAVVEEVAHMLGS